ncbi:MAG: hypothetical protein HC881_22545 [Leptolyngbyaceae cyanobacterium SL_7_1]|nr:hypothetical protein [Leptolyngbyaceae cyanobacterium SL_7_1]
MTSLAGSIDTTTGGVFTDSDLGNAGTITLSALGAINTSDLSATSTVAAGGDVTLTSGTGLVNTSLGSVDAFGTTAGGQRPSGCGWQHYHRGDRQFGNHWGGRCD